MIYKKSKAVIQARMNLIQQALDEINNIPDTSNFSREVFYIIAQFGLQIPAHEEGLFTNDNQANPELSHEAFKLRIKRFLFKYIK